MLSRKSLMACLSLTLAWGVFPMDCHGSVKDRLRATKSYYTETREKASEKKADLKAKVKEKREKVEAKAKAAGQKVTTSFGIDMILKKEGGKEVETTESLLLRLDNMVSAETILKMIFLGMEDMKFQLGKRSAKFDQSRAYLDKKLTEIQNAMEALRIKVTQKVAEKIGRSENEIKTYQQLTDAAKNIKDTDLSKMYTGLSIASSLMDSEVIEGVRGVMVNAGAKSKINAQKDIDNLNTKMLKVQENLEKQRGEMAKILGSSKFKSEMASLQGQYDKVISLLGELSDAFADARLDGDYFNYINTKDMKFDDMLGDFAKKAGCDVTLQSGDDLIPSLIKAKDTLKNCKKNIINGIASKKDVPFLKNDTAFQSISTCKSLSEEADIVDVEKCLKDYGGIDLSSFGSAVVK